MVVLLPAAVGGWLFVGLYTLSEFGAVSLLRYDTFTRTIYLSYTSSFDRSAAAAMRRSSANNLPPSTPTPAPPTAGTMLYLHGGQKLWDYAAGSLILAEAGLFGLMAGSAGLLLSVIGARVSECGFDIFERDDGIGHASGITGLCDRLAQRRHDGRRRNSSHSTERWS